MTVINVGAVVLVVGATVVIYVHYLIHPALVKYRKKHPLHLARRTIAKNRAL